MGKSLALLFVGILIIWSLSLAGSEDKFSFNSNQLVETIEEKYIKKFILNDIGKVEEKIINVDFLKTQSLVESQEDIPFTLILLEYIGYRNLVSYVSSNNQLDIHNWTKKSFYLTYDCDFATRNCNPNYNFDYIEEFEFNAPNGMTIFSVKPVYYIMNGVIDSGPEIGKYYNSYYFLVNISIFNFKSNIWRPFYTDNSTGGGWRNSRSLLYMEPNFINNSKIRLRVEVRNRDDTSSYAWTYFEYSNGTYLTSSAFLFDKIWYEYSTISVSSPPSFSNIPDKNISQDEKLPAHWIDLWNYVSDEDTPKDKLNFFIDNQSDFSLINCWIDVNRYVTCDMPTKGQTGYSDVTVRVKDTQGSYDTDTFRINVISPSLTIFIIPFDWNASYQSYSEKADEVASYFLERIPLSNCPIQFKLLKAKENENYGRFWDGWKCNTSSTHNLSNIHCFFSNKALGRIDDCAERYRNSKNEKYNYVVGISDNDISIMEGSSCKNLAGWSGELPSIIAETRTLRTTTHELGHQFGLQDQYCDCSGTSYKSYCGPSASKSPLNMTLGCDYNKDCCLNATLTNYPYNPSCRWCDGNFDRFGEDTDNNQILDSGNRTLMGGYPSDHFDINEYSHLSTLPEFQCKNTQFQSMSVSSMLFSFQDQNESDFNLEIMLNIDKNDNITLLELNFTELEPFSTKNEGEYSLKILDQNSNTLYQKNFSVDFIIFSDPPIITNESIIFEIVNYSEGMKKLEIYHNNNLIFFYNIPSFCNKNSVCESGENYLSCSDCKSNAQDGICNREKGDGCDFDCIEGLDSDCVDLVILNVNLEENLTEGKQTEIKMNISNFGIRNATFEIGLFLNSILEKNVTANTPGNFSSLTEFNWTPKQGCFKDLIFSLDFLNEINEVNKTNNELTIKNVSIGLRGDVIINFKVDIFDLAAVGLCYGKDATGSCATADLSGNGKVDIFDLATVGLNYGEEC